jgi:hypothetical protein
MDHCHKQIVSVDFFSFFKQMKSIHRKKDKVRHETKGHHPSRPKAPSLPHNAATTW